jgi:hypothetical protein
MPEGSNSCASRKWSTLVPYTPSRPNQRLCDLSKNLRPSHSSIRSPVQFPPANPVIQPAPLASFGNHFAATQAALKTTPPTCAEQRGLRIRTACEALISSCIHCWAHGLDYRSHSLADCQLNRINEMHPAWPTWVKLLKLPLDCCFFCGCPLKV